MPLTRRPATTTNKNTELSIFLFSLLILSPHVLSFSVTTTPKNCPPQLIVLDLDNTVWTPELYQLRKRLGKRTAPVAGQDVRLFPGAQRVLDRWREDDTSQPQLAIASRTQSVDWAFALLDDFGIADLFDYIQIFPGSKLEHFRRIQEDSGVAYGDMLFFDDARDGKYGNCAPVAELGVLAVHCPKGIHHEAVFDRAMEYFSETWDGSKGVVLTEDGTVANERNKGRIKFVNEEKQFGFLVPEEDPNRRDVFFHFNNLPEGLVVGKGDILSYAIAQDPRSGKDRATDIKFVSSNGKATFKTFSMGLPFAALLANGYKTLESRNNEVFLPCIAGTQLLLHVGRNTYDDGDSHLDIMKQDGLTMEEIEKLKSMPDGFDRGMIVAVCEVGSTNEMRIAQRTDPSIERKIVAVGQDSGKFVTEIRRVEYLKQPIPMKGKPGIFPVTINRNVLPDGWELEDSQPPAADSMSKPPSSSSTNSRLVYSISSD